MDVDLIVENTIQHNTTPVIYEVGCGLSLARDEHEHEHETAYSLTD